MLVVEQSVLVGEQSVLVGEQSVLVLVISNALRDP